MVSETDDLEEERVLQDFTQMRRLERLTSRQMIQEPEGQAVEFCGSEVSVGGQKRPWRSLVAVAVASV